MDEVLKELKEEGLFFDIRADKEEETEK